MNISKRLLSVVDLIDSCDSVCDIGTDHGYVPIYLIKNNKCRKAIASDINKGPLEKSKKNISRYNLQYKIECRLGCGFEKINKGECEVAVIAGMGGNLICDIIEKNIPVFKEFKYVILQPAQNTEVLRKYIYERGFKILNETVVEDEGIYYQNIKINYDEDKRFLEPIFYEVGENLYKTNKDFILHKIEENKKILSFIKGESKSSKKRKELLITKINKLEKLYEK